MEDFSDKAVALLQKLIWPIVGVVVIAVLGGAGYAYTQNQNLKKLQASQDQLFVIKRDLEKVMNTINPPEPTPEMDKDGKPLPPKAKKAAPVTSDSEKEKLYAPLVERLNTFIKANQGQQSAVEAALLVAEVTADYKKANLGIEPLKQALTGLDKNNFMFGVGQTELGNLLADANQCAEAAQSWEAVLAQKEHSYLANDLRLKTGICYEKTNQLDRAENQYRKVIDLAPDSTAARTAKKFLLHINYVKAKGVQPEPTKG